MFFLMACLGGGDRPVVKEKLPIACKPKKMSKQGECVGEDNSFTECRFFFRVFGVPESQWCMQLKEQAASDIPVPACDFDNPQKWAKVSCSAYQFNEALDCYACNISQLESNRSYVYAYNSDCSKGIEQVTCNTSPKNIKMFQQDTKWQRVR